VEEPLGQDLRVVGLEELACRFRPRLALRRRADRGALDLLHDEEPGRGQVVVDGGNLEPRVRLEHLAHPVDVRGLLPEVELALQ
jgi:hypothetical protein